MFGNSLNFYIIVLLRLIKMSFDYFGEGLSQKTGIKFTEQQQIFFNNKLPILDPNRKNCVKAGDALGLLKFANLQPGVAKKILDNLKLTGKSTLDYSEMKKVLRGVALAQNKIEPSSININANIKTKLPQFYDDSDEQQKEQQGPPPKEKSGVVDFFAQPQKQAQVAPAKKPPAQVAPVQAKPMMTQSRVRNQQPTNKQAPKSHEAQKNNESDKNFKKFFDFWETLTTEGGVKISGSQVKRLFGKSQNRNELSKIWKLCSNTYKGSLSKGELYVFITLMKSKSGNIPSALTPGMKQTIKKIDDENTHKQKPKGGSGNNIQSENNFFDMDKSHNFNQSQQVRKTSDLKVEKKSSQANRASAAISNFDDFANFANPNQVIKRIQSPKNKLNMQRQVLKKESHHSESHEQMKVVQFPKQVIQHPKKLVQSIHMHSARHLQQMVSVIVPQLQQLSQQNKESTVALQQTNQILNNIDQAHTYFVNKINELKVAQDNTNHHLNLTCRRMRDIIVKQTELINSIFGVLEGQVQMGNGRLTILQNYTHEAEEKANNQVNQFNQIQENNRNNNKVTINKIQSSADIPERNIGNSTQVIENPPQAPHHQRQSYNKKSMQSMREMAESMAVSKSKNKIQQEPVYPEGGGIYRQKLMEQLREQQRMHQENTNMEESSAQSSVAGRNSIEVGGGGYHWNIGDRHQVAHPINQKNQLQLKKVDSEASEEDQSQAKSRQRRYKEQIQQQQIKQQQQQAQLQAQQQAQLQVQQQSEALADQQVRLQNLLQANLQAQAQTQGDEQQIAARNLKIKKIRLIQMINYISPITPEALPIISQKIEQMTENMIDATYAKLYKYNYLPKMEQEQRNASKGQKANVIAMPNQDQFSSNNFRNEELNKPKQSFFL